MYSQIKVLIFFIATIANTAQAVSTCGSYFKAQQDGNEKFYLFQAPNPRSNEVRVKYVSSVAAKLPSVEIHFFFWIF